MSNASDSNKMHKRKHSIKSLKALPFSNIKTFLSFLVEIWHENVVIYMQIRIHVKNVDHQVSYLQRKLKAATKLTFGVKVWKEMLQNNIIHISLIHKEIQPFRISTRVKGAVALNSR